MTECAILQAVLHSSWPASPLLCHWRDSVALSAVPYCTAVLCAQMTKRRPPAESAAQRLCWLTTMTLAISPSPAPIASCLSISTAWLAGRRDNVPLLSAAGRPRLARNGYEYLGRTVLLQVLLLLCTTLGCGRAERCPGRRAPQNRAAAPGGLGSSRLFTKVYAARARWRRHRGFELYLLFLSNSVAGKDITGVELWRDSALLQHPLRPHGTCAVISMLCKPMLLPMRRCEHAVCSFIKYAIGGACLQVASWWRCAGVERGKSAALPGGQVSRPIVTARPFISDPQRRLYFILAVHHACVDNCCDL
jgi:hypothetical protein